MPDPIVCFPPSRVKKIIQSNDEIGKMMASVPVVVSSATEQFLREFVNEVAHIAEDSDVRTIKATHIEQCISKFPEKYGFLRPVLPPETELEK
ncbi:hypothetical protein RCL1_007147 [Eukaryota sp. TZLM3-RCL]